MAKWTKDQHKKFSATMKRKKKGAKTAVQHFPLDAIPADEPRKPVARRPFQAMQIDVKLGSQLMFTLGAVQVTVRAVR